MKKIFLAGHKGMVGSAIHRKLEKRKDLEVVTRNHCDLDLCDQKAVEKFMKKEQPDEVIIAAAKVGGIYANNKYPANFIYENIQIQTNLIHISHLHNVQKLLFLGSSCIYPKFAPQPIKEEALLSGFLEQTNEPYAIAKIAGIKMCESYNRQYGRDYRSIMPSNIYGPGDNYHIQNSHVIPGLIRRFHEAKIKGLKNVIIWGSGKPKREFLFVEDMATACLLIHELDTDTFMNNKKNDHSHINVGSGLDITIRELAKIIKEVTKYDGELIFDISKEDGTPRKILDISLIKKLGWKAQTSLKSGLYLTYKNYISTQKFI